MFSSTFQVKTIHGIGPSEGDEECMMEFASDIDESTTSRCYDFDTDEADDSTAEDRPW